MIKNGMSISVTLTLSFLMNSLRIVRSIKLDVAFVFSSNQSSAFAEKFSIFPEFVFSMSWAID